jgi:hypothetical protein
VTPRYREWWGCSCCWGVDGWNSVFIRHMLRQAASDWPGEGNCTLAGMRPNHPPPHVLLGPGAGTLICNTGTWSLARGASSGHGALGSWPDCREAGRGLCCGFAHPSDAKPPETAECVNVVSKLEQLS